MRRESVDLLGKGTSARPTLSSDNLPDLGDPNRVRSDLLIEIEESGNITNKIAKAMADGRISRREAASIRQAIQHRRDKEDDYVLRTLAAIEANEVQA